MKDEEKIEKLIKIYSMLAKIESIHVKVIAMGVENKIRQFRNESLAYDETLFNMYADDLEEVEFQLLNLL